MYFHFKRGYIVIMVKEFLNSIFIVREFFFASCSACQLIVLSSQQKVQSDLTSHEISLEEMKKHNQGKEAAQRVLSQIDVAQVHITA